MNASSSSSAALGTILSIWAHPDDETYLSAGVMARARDHGQRVVCASASAGEHGTADPGRWPPDRLGEVRRTEAAVAMAVLGVAEHHVLGLPDGGLADHDDAGLAWVTALFDEVRPDTVLTFGPDGMTYHSDHIAVHRWVTQVWFARGCRSRLLYATPTVDRLARFGDLYEEWRMYMTDERPAGVPTDRLALHLLLDKLPLERKLRALRAMPSQTAALFADLDPQVYAGLVAEEAFVEAIAEQAVTTP